MARRRQGFAAPGCARLYFDQSIHLCANAGFSPRLRYEASTVHGVLELVGAGLGVALVPESTAVLGVAGDGGLSCRRGDAAPLAALPGRGVWWRAYSSASTSSQV